MNKVGSVHSPLVSCQLSISNVRCLCALPKSVRHILRGGENLEPKIETTSNASFEAEAFHDFPEVKQETCKSGILAANFEFFQGHLRRSRCQPVQEKLAKLGERIG